MILKPTNSLKLQYSVNINNKLCDPPCESLLHCNLRNETCIKKNADKNVFCKFDKIIAEEKCGKESKHEKHEKAAKQATETLPG